MQQFRLDVTDLHGTTEMGATSDEYDFFLEALIVAASVADFSWIDDNRVELAKGETLTYPMPGEKSRVITITETN